MVRHLWFFGVLVFWGIMVALLIQKDILPSTHYQQPPTYRSMLAGLDAPRHSVMDAYYEEARVGEVDIVEEPLPGGKGYRIRQQVTLDMPTVGRCEIQAKTDVDPDFLLRRVEIRSRMGVLSAMFTGNRIMTDEDVMLDLNIVSPLGTIHETVPLRENTTFSTSLTPHGAIPYLWVGKTWEHEVFNPLMPDRPQIVKAEVVDEEWVAWGEDEYRCYVVQFDYGLFKDRIWIAAEDGSTMRAYIGLLKLTLTRRREWRP